MASLMESAEVGVGFPSPQAARFARLRVAMGSFPLVVVVGLLGFFLVPADLGKMELKIAAAVPGVVSFSFFGESPFFFLVSSGEARAASTFPAAAAMIAFVGVLGGGIVGYVG